MTEDLKKACEILANGGLILYPTDTIWGIGCDATNQDAVNRIFSLKQRVDSKALIVLLDTTAKLDYYVEDVPDLALDLIEMSDKPITIIYDKGKNIASNLLADDCSIAIRITQERFSNELCKRFRKPIVSTSANISGTKAPACFSEIEDTIKSGVDYIVKYRQDEKQKAKASSILKLGNDGEIKIIRE